MSRLNRNERNEIRISSEMARKWIFMAKTINCADKVKKSVKWQNRMVTEQIKMATEVRK